MDHFYASILVPSERVEDIEKTFGKLARRIEKGKTVAMVPPTVEATRSVVMVVTETGGYRYAVPGQDDGEKLYDFAWLTVRYAQPKMAEWSLVAVYDWEQTPDGIVTYVHTVPGEMVPEEYRDPQPNECDHCHIKRFRRKSMLLRNNDDYGYMIVGSSCVKDFLGHLSEKTLTELFTLHKFVNDCQYNPPGGTPTAYLSTREVIAISAAVVEEYGYVPAGSYTGWPTGDMVRSYIRPTCKAHHELRADCPVEEKHRDTAEAVAQWIEGNDDLSEYFDTLRKAVAAGWITERRIGIVASAVRAYQKAHPVEVAQEEIVNEHVGNLKERLRGITVTVKEIGGFMGSFGWTNIVKMQDEKGRAFAWFATNGVQGMEVNSTYTIDGTVKGHGEFKGRKETVLNRVTIKEECEA